MDSLFIHVVFPAYYFIGSQIVLIGKSNGGATLFGDICVGKYSMLALFSHNITDLSTPYILKVDFAEHIK